MAHGEQVARGRKCISSMRMRPVLNGQSPVALCRRPCPRLATRQNASFRHHPDWVGKILTCRSTAYIDGKQLTSQASITIRR